MPKIAEVKLVQKAMAMAKKVRQYEFLIEIKETQFRQRYIALAGEHVVEVERRVLDLLNHSSDLFKEVTPKIQRTCGSIYRAVQIQED